MIVSSSNRENGLGRRRMVRDRRGAMLVFIAIAGVVLMGFLAMTLDVGAGSRQRRIAQTAADAGAIGGGQEIFRLKYDSVVASARNEAMRNGFAATEITVNYPPATGTYANNTQYVEVIVGKKIPTLFGSIFGSDSLGIQARGVAGVGSYNLNCVYSLDEAVSGALYIDNGGDLVTNCGVVVNSGSKSALDLNSSGDLDARPAPISIRGNYSAGGGASATPTPQTGTATVVNPLASIVMPPVGLCDHNGVTTVTGTMTLEPGVYCGGIKIANSSSTAILKPGTYIMAGGGITVTNSGRMFGTGVTLINTVGPGGLGTFKPIIFGNGCKTTLTAPTSGYFKGILFFQDPAAPATPTNVFACSSDAPPELTGALYFPNSTITFNGSNSSTQVVGMVVAKQVIVSGKISILNDISGNSAAKRLSLVQ